MFLTIVDERTDEEVLQFYSPPDLIVGKTVFILGRRFYIYDCDAFTRRYYQKVYRIDQPKVELPKEEEKKIAVQNLPPYTGFGTHMDSLLSHYHLDPKAVNVVDKMELIRNLHNFNKKLRYTAEMDYFHPEDRNRQFIIEYRLSDGHVMIHELKQRNSGFPGGRFLKHTLVPKPNTNPDNPEYFTPHDFRLGSIVEMFGHRFKITGVDLAVYRYMQANPEKFSTEIVEEARKHLVREGFLTDDVNVLSQFRKTEELAEPVMGNQMEAIEQHQQNV